MKTPHLSDDEDRVFGLECLRDITPPASLVPAVMRRIAEPAPLSFWGWLLKPRRIELRLSPLRLAGVAVAAGLVLAAWSLVGREHSRFVVQVPATTEQPAVVVRFTLMADGARQVAVAGDFNEWNPDQIRLERDGNGRFSATVKLPPGAHEYMFIVDGKWVTDPAAAELRPDGFGRTNAVLRL
jgi:hypothetical protein